MVSVWATWRTVTPGWIRSQVSSQQRRGVDELGLGHEVALNRLEVAERQPEALIGAELSADLQAGGVEAGFAQQLAEHLDRNRHVDVRLDLLPAGALLDRGQVAAVDDRGRLALEREHDGHRAHLVLELRATVAGEVVVVVAVRQEESGEAGRVHRLTSPRPAAL
jgi:hypothetical protein